MGTLTPRQYELLSLLATGVTYRDAAARMGISYQTSKNMATAIYKKLGVGGMVEALNAVGWVRVPADNVDGRGA